MHLHPAPRGRDDHLARAGLAVLVRILAGGVHVELVMRVLQRGNPQSAGTQHRDQPLQQVGLAGAAPADDAQYPWRRHAVGYQRWKSATKPAG
jgi:hypothetical protein